AGYSGRHADRGGRGPDLIKKRLPAVSHVAVLWNASKANTGGPYTFRQTETAGLKLGLRIQSLAVMGPSELERAIEAASRNRAGAVLRIFSPHTRHRSLIWLQSAVYRSPRSTETSLRSEDCCHTVTIF